jgi:hypothetical protein
MNTAEAREARERFAQIHAHHCHLGIDLKADAAALVGHVNHVFIQLLTGARYDGWNRMVWGTEAGWE